MSIGEPDRQKREEINDLKMNEPKFKQQGLLCRNGLDTKKCEIDFVYSHFFSLIILKPNLKKEIPNVVEILGKPD